MLFFGRFLLAVTIALQTPTSFSNPEFEYKLTQLENNLKKNEQALKALKKQRLAFKKKKKKKTIVKLSLFEKDYTRYPDNPNPPYFSASNEEGSSEIEFHTWLQGDQDLFFNTMGLTINDGLTSLPVIDKNTVDRFWLRRIRPEFEGKIYDYINFLVNVDFGQEQTTLFDAFIDINYWRLLGLQVGQQMSLVSGIENYFNNFSYLSRAFTQENSYPSLLAPDREFGFVFHGSLGPSGHEAYFRGLSYLGFDNFFSYQIGLLSGTPDYTQPGSVPINFVAFDHIPSSLSNKAFEGRLFLNPFINQEGFVLQHLGFGFSGSSERASRNSFDLSTGIVGPPAILSVGQNPIFVYQVNVTDLGPRTRLHPQALWSYGPIGVLADWTQTLQELKSVVIPDLNDPSNPTLKQLNKASQIQLIYNITQEEFNLFHLIPNQNFHLLDRHALGAFQAVFRVSTLTLDGNVFNDYIELFEKKTYYFADPRVSIQKANTWSIGLNWYWTQNLRISAEYDHTQFTGGCSTGAIDSKNGTPGCITGSNLKADSQVINRPSEQIFMSRFQITF
jgi:phosphate-selective porin OprO/OprP